MRQTVWIRPWRQLGIVIATGPENVMVKTAIREDLFLFSDLVELPSRAWWSSQKEIDQMIVQESLGGNGHDA